jgi:hypothetical protein
MKTSMRSLVKRMLSMTTVAGSLVCGNSGQASNPAPAEKFVVHEWGVHIRASVPVLYEAPVLIPESMGGLEMKVVEDPTAKPRNVLAPPEPLISGLPNFVLRHATEYNPRFGTGSWDKPIIHFYGREGTEISLQVLTPQGRPLAYWPKPAMVEKKGYRRDLHTMGLAGPELLGIAWKGRLSAKPAVHPAAVKEGHWWQTVREVPSLWFDAGPTSERFIFYEATALQEPVLLGKVGAEDLTLENTDAADSGPVLVIVNDGQARHFMSVPGVGPKATVKFARKDILAAEGDAAKLLAACRVQWEAFGMTKDEAKAIVETWKPDLLDRTGFLVISRIPSKVYDGIFPLEIKPEPDQIVRAGVIFDTLPGEATRLVWLPGLQAMFDKLLQELTADEFKVRMAARKRLVGCGELAAPFVERLIESRDPEVLDAVKEFQSVMKAARVIMPAFHRPNPEGQPKR